MSALLTKLLHNRRIHLLIIVVVCILTYLPILTNSFAYDDESFFLNWKTPKSFGNVQKFIEGDTPPNHEGNYRPLRTLIYAVDYKLWGENPTGYHARGIVTNAVIAALVYLIAAAITGNSLAAFVTALLFGVHPDHTEAVTFATASMDTIGIAFAFASFYLYLTASRVGSKRFYASVVCAILSFFIYEVALMLPVLMLLYRFCFRKKPLGLPAKPTALWYFGAAGYYALMRVLLVRQNTGRPLGYHGGSFFMSMLLVSKFFSQYLLLLVFPVQLSIFHQIAPGINTFMISKDAINSLAWIDIQNIVSVVIVLLTLIAAYVSYRKRPIISFSILWFYISMIPTLNILPTHSLFAERYVFFASFGYCLILGYFLTKRLKKTNKYASDLPGIQAGAVLFLTLSYILLTVLRNNDWKNPASLWTEVTQRAPDSPVGWNNLGLAHESNMKYDLAIDHYKKSIQLDPAYPNAHTNLGRLHLKRGDYEDAMREFELAVKAAPDNIEFKANFTNARRKIYEVQKNNMTPEEKKVREEIDNLITASRKQLMSDDTTKALAMIEEKLVKYPDSEVLLNDAAVIYMSRREFKKSIEYLNRAIQTEPGDPNLYLNLGNAYMEDGNNNRARDAFKTALELDPEDKTAQRLLEKVK